MANFHPIHKTEEVFEKAGEFVVHPTDKGMREEQENIREVEHGTFKPSEHGFDKNMDKFVEEQKRKGSTSSTSSASSGKSKDGEKKGGILGSVPGMRR